MSFFSPGNVVTRSSTSSRILNSPVNRGMTFGMLGNSITQENFDQSASSNQALFRWFHAANALMGGRMNLVNNAGVAGDTTAQMLARVIANGSGLGVGFGGIGAAGVAVTTNPSPLLNLPNYCFVLGGVNDIYGFNLSKDTITANLGAIYTFLWLSGVTPIAMSIPPVGTATVGYSTANVATHLAVNQWIQDYAADNPNIIFIDAFKAMVDPLNASVCCLPGLTRDTRQHPNNLGSLYIGREIARVLSPLIPEWSFLPSSNAATFALDPTIAQLMPNPLLTGTAAIAANGWAGNTAGSNLGNGNFVRGGAAPTCAVSSAARVDNFGSDIQMDFTFNASGDNMEIRFPSQHANVVVGGAYVAVAQITCSGPGGADLTAADNLQGAQLYLQYNNGANFLSYAMARAATDVALVGSYTMTLQTYPLTIPAGGAAAFFRPNFTVYAAGAGTPRVKFGRYALYRVS